MMTAYMVNAAIVAYGPLRTSAEEGQNMGMPALQPPRYTAADVLAMPAQPGHTVEVIDGELFVTLAPSLAHERVVMVLGALIYSFTRDQRLGSAFTVAADIVPAANTLVQPDIFVIPHAPNERPSSWGDVKRLLLAVEVLSPSSQRRDRVVKRHLYAQMDCEYWIVDADARIIERWLPDDKRPDICERILEWHPVGASEPLRINLEALFTEALD